MKSWFGLPITGAVAGALLLTACVTINVYFPAAEAKEAAREFVEKVIEEAPPANDDGGMAWVQPKAGGPGADGFDPWMLLGIGSAHAQSQPDINIRTPAIQSIQSRMEARFNSILRDGFNSGALGFTNDGMLVVRDAGKLALKDRVVVNNAVADDNRDRKAVYREIAVANGHPEWESQIRLVFAQQWIESARSGWWYQDASGNWKQK